MGIDATRKWPEEGFTGRWPDEIKMDDGNKAARGRDLWRNLKLELKSKKRRISRQALHALLCPAVVIAPQTPHNA